MALTTTVILAILLASAWIGFRLLSSKNRSDSTSTTTLARYRYIAVLSSLFALAATILFVSFFFHEARKNSLEPALWLDQAIEKAPTPTTAFEMAIHAGNSFQKTGDFNNAKRLYDRALRIGETIGPTFHARALVRMSQTETDNRQAYAILEDALAIQTTHLSHSDPTLAETLERMAWFHSPPNGDIGKGQVLLERAILVRRDNESRLDLAETLSQYAFFILFDDAERAAKTLEEALDLRMGVLGISDQLTQETVLQTADYHLIAGSPTLAAGILHVHYPGIDENVQTGVAYRLAWCHVLKNEFDEALRWFELAKEHFLGTSSVRSDPLRAITLELGLGFSYLKMNRQQEATESVKRAETYAESLFREDPLETLIESMVSLPEPTEPPEPERQWTVNRWLHYRDLLDSIADLNP